MKKILIYDTTIIGHHLEYLHHIYEHFVKEKVELYFVLSKIFEDYKHQFSWTESKNVYIHFLSELEYANVSKHSYFSSAWNNARVIGKYAKRFNIDYIYLIELIQPYPFLPFFIPTKCRVCGIIYRLYLYKWEQASFIVRIKDTIETFSMVYSDCTHRIQLLNDSSAVAYYNRKFHTKKFSLIIDPIVPISYKSKNIRANLSIPDNFDVFLHMGGMQRRKGTLKILEAISMLEKENLKNKVFIFAGLVSNEIKEEFYTRYNQLKDKTRIIIFDDILPYEQLGDLCETSDYVVLPYDNYDYSSGVIGYASQFGKCVIGPSRGILGKLIKRYNMGVVIDLNVSALASIIKNPPKIKMYRNKYAVNNSVEKFVKCIERDLMN